ncbi:hypothetical protein bsdcttw_22070 [Anaerocolumna chitinilytica]|uniref:Uncharacterized protein n=1 Tax=Anaerocolumna chitinilytica TaxID=1727145 RepID=A0A7I8DSB1_9FIRM|nr:hypothetical protein bsdcttw_22070 [Anaerocolumna chitinilytica]
MRIIGITEIQVNIYKKRFLKLIYSYPPYKNLTKVYHNIEPKYTNSMLNYKCSKNQLGGIL